MSKTNDWTKTELEKYVTSMTAVTIPVNLHIKGQQRVFSFSEIGKILKEAKLIALGECYCRKKLQKCNSPIDVCISFDKIAKDEINSEASKKVSLTQALKALKRSHEAGLVHLAFTFEGKEKPEFICSCCSCCCHSLGALIRFGMANAVLTSRYIAINNVETCMQCGKCVERCQFKARRLENGEMMFDAARCFGCGVCLTTCPTNSISMTERVH